MNTIHVYGSQYLTPNRGMALLRDPSEYITVTVAYDMLDVYYPIPVNATNIVVKMDGSELNWAKESTRFFISSPLTCWK